MSLGEWMSEAQSVKVMAQMHTEEHGGIFKKQCAEWGGGKKRKKQKKMHNPVALTKIKIHAYKIAAHVL